MEAMGKLLTPLTRRESVAMLRQKLAQSDDAEQKTRIRAIIHSKEGASRAEVGRRFCIDAKTLRSWVRAYNDGGTRALLFSKGGRPEGNPVWDTSIFNALVAEIDKGGRYWSVPLMQEWITQNYQKEIPESTVWYHIRGLDYSCKSARPHPYQGEKKAQQAFKKGASLTS
jgi:transposase